MEGEQSLNSPVKKGSSVLNQVLPPNKVVWGQVRLLAGEAKSRVSELADGVCQDPIILIEILKTANSMQYSAGRSLATTVKSAIDRLGSEALIEVLDKLADYAQLEGEEIVKYYDGARIRCCRTGRVAGLLCEVVSRNLVEECEISGLLFHFGDMLAVAGFKSDFIKLAKDLPRVKLLYRLEKDFRFDPQKMGLTYLKRFGVPEALLFALDPEAQAKSPSKGIMKPICQAASEMVLSFESERWDKLSPGSPIPPKSALRMLGMNDSQYAALYERVDSYLNPKDSIKDS